MKLSDIIKSYVVCAVLISVVNVSFAENIDPDEDDSQYAYGENVGCGILRVNIGAHRVHRENINSF